MCEERERDTGRVPGVKGSEGTCICVDNVCSFYLRALGFEGPHTVMNRICSQACRAADNQANCLAREVCSVASHPPCSRSHA